MRAYPHLVVKCAFHGWQRVTRKEQAEQWEKLARARRFRQRYVRKKLATDHMCTKKKKKKKKKAGKK